MVKITDYGGHMMIPPVTGEWFVRTRGRRGDKLQIFCFHFAGGSSAQYAGWDRLLSDEIDVVSVQLPGRETRQGEPLARSIEDFMPDLVAAFVDQTKTGHYVLFGHSLGALIAFELVRALRRLDKPLPLHLFVASRPAPQIFIEHPVVRELPESRIIDALRLYGGTADHILTNRRLMRVFLPIVRADLEINQRYQYGSEPALDCPITAFCGDRDPVCLLTQIDSWSEQTKRTFRRVVVNGGHFLVRDNTREIVDTIQETLFSVDATSHGNNSALQIDNQ